MSNNPTQDAFNPNGIGSEFEKHLFDELNPGEIFRVNDNDGEIQYRKENDTQALSLGEGLLHDVDSKQVVYIKI
tara:strand:+ start:187 stop:408 length:222 start_codon:yes stop_codon:yes gene_type:complete